MLDGLLPFLADVFSQDWVKAILSSLVGGALSGGAVLLIDRHRRRTDQIAAINIAVAFLISHLNGLLNFKQQMVAPKVAELAELLNVLKRVETARSDNTDGEPIGMAIDELGSTITVRETEFLIDLATLAGHTSQFTGTIMTLVKCKEALAEIPAQCDDFNDLVREMRAQKMSVTLLTRYLGVKQNDGTTDVRLDNVVGNLADSTDAALFFTKQGLEHLLGYARASLPKRLVPRVRWYKIPDTHKQFMPADDYIKNWHKPPSRRQNFHRRLLARMGISASAIKDVGSGSAS